MPQIPAFGSWDESAHAGDKQQRTISRAQLSETTPLSVDHTAQTAVFYGSGKDPYQTSLSTCTCNDFSRRGLPCKHIYRLAMELGIVDLPFQTGMSKGERLDMQISFEDSVNFTESLPESAQLFLAFMLNSTHSSIADRRKAFLVDDPSIIAAFRSCPLLEEQSAVPMMLSKLKREALNALIEHSGISDHPKKNASSAVLSQWIQEHVPNLDDFLPPYAAFSFIANFDRSQRSLFTYLTRKYDNDCICNASFGRRRSLAGRRNPN